MYILAEYCYNYLTFRDGGIEGGKVMRESKLWSDGYVTEIPYTYGFYEHLSPFSIELCLVGVGYRSPAWREGFTYCELGCGHGITALILACLYPQGQFYVTDFNPVHAEYLAYFVKLLGLDNLHYTDASFEEYSQISSSVMFDYISLHGVYSWISGENRKYIQDIIQKRLKLGGVVSISYNVLPGWLMTLPIRELMKRYQQTECSSNLVERLKKSIEFLEKMQENNAIFLKNESVKRRIEHIKEGNISYIMHEYFNKDWHPLYSSEVIDEMSSVKLNYVCSADILDNIPSCNFVTNVYEHLSSVYDIGTRELTRDLYLNTQFRKDIYIKGGQKLKIYEQEEWMKKQNIVLLLKKEDINFQPSHGMVQINLSRTVYEPIIDNLKLYEPVPLYEFYQKLGFIQEEVRVVLKQDAKTQPFPLPAFWECLFTLLGFGYIHLYEQSTYNYYSVGKFNNFIIHSGQFKHEIPYIILPNIYSVLSLTHLEFLFLNWELGNKKESLFNYVTSFLDKHGLGLAADDGRPLTTTEEQMQLLEKKYATYSETTKPKLVHFGALASLQELI